MASATPRGRTSELSIIAVAACMMTSQGKELEGLLWKAKQIYIFYCGAYIILNDFIIVVVVYAIATAQFGQLNNRVRLAPRPSFGESLEGG
jgi:choline-glycine betaine transporter